MTFPQHFYHQYYAKLWQITQLRVKLTSSSSRCAEGLIWLGIAGTSFIMELNCHVGRGLSRATDTILRWEAENWPESDFNWSRNIDRLVPQPGKWIVRSPLDKQYLNSILSRHALLSFPRRRISCEGTIRFRIKQQYFLPRWSNYVEAKPLGFLITVKVYQFVWPPVCTWWLFKYFFLQCCSIFILNVHCQLTVCAISINPLSEVFHNV